MKGIRGALDELASAKILKHFLKLLATHPSHIELHEDLALVLDVNDVLGT